MEDNKNDKKTVSMRQFIRNDQDSSEFIKFRVTQTPEILCGEFEIFDGSNIASIYFDGYGRDNVKRNYQEYQIFKGMMLAFFEAYEEKHNEFMEICDIE